MLARWQRADAQARRRRGPPQASRPHSHRTTSGNDTAVRSASVLPAVVLLRMLAVNAHLDGHYATMIGVGRTRDTVTHRHKN